MVSKLAKEEPQLHASDLKPCSSSNWFCCSTNHTTYDANQTTSWYNFAAYLVKHKLAITSIPVNVKAQQLLNINQLAPIGVTIHSDVGSLKPTGRQKKHHCLKLYKLRGLYQVAVGSCQIEAPSPFMNL